MAMLGYLFTLLAFAIICQSIKNAFKSAHVPDEEEEKTWNVWANESAEPNDNITP